MAELGASRIQDIAPEHLANLNAGTAQARTLTEALAIDHPTLLRAALPDAGPALTAATDEAQRLGILKRMTTIGGAVHTHLDAAQRARLATHSSDTVRGWACFAVGAQSLRHLSSAAAVAELLTQIRPFADDPHFTVREWAWMAIRNPLVARLPEAITALSSWTSEPSPRVRRFASEALRPRGVWAAHIPALKAAPELGNPLLEPLRSDPDRSVQDSVANWINDAAKTRPEWARDLAARWLAQSPEVATERIVARGLRSIS